ncbi:MAG: YitT family protein [Vallitalea sp.]|jgi:uncharacterized membrane-anchored protein YitT (DUF2179 family)|nr:YitT family protein [Vallitalea sp.]
MKNTVYNIKQYISIIVGTFLMALSINGLYIPHKILSGGVTGIAVFLHLLFGLNTSIAILVLNIPLMIIGYFLVNKRFIGLSIFGMISLSVCLALTKNIVFNTNEMLTSILLGSVITGFGSGLIFRFNGSTGGSDIIAKIVNKYFSYSISSVGFAINVIIIGLSCSFFGIDLAVYTLVTMFISSHVMKFVLEGLDHKRTVFIITNKEKEISNCIMSELHRGVTIIHGTGAYTNEPRHILYCIIGIRQVAKLRSLIRRIDENAFISVTDTSFVYGNGRGFQKNNAD